MIERIEDIGAKNEPGFFCHTEGTSRREICLDQVETMKSVPPEISLRGRGGHDQGRRIELPPTGNVGINDPLRDSGNQVRSEIIAPETNISLESDIDWQPG